MALSEERRNEIAMLFIKHRIRKSNLPLADLGREVGNMAKAMGIKTDEAMEFIEPIYREVLNEAFEKKDSKTSVGFKPTLDERNKH